LREEALLLLPGWAKAGNRDELLDCSLGQSRDHQGM
jgi:hypothetical protein